MQRLLLILGMIISFNSIGQVKISGTVRDTKGKAMHAANITLKDTYDGAVSDSFGHFSFVTTEKGNLEVEVKYVGYKSFSQKVIIDKEPIKLNCILKEELSELKAVTVTAGSFEAGDKKRAATVMSSLDIVTTAGSNGDISTALKTLPGAQQVGEQEGLFVRGGAGYETKQFIDGTLVNNPYYSSVQDIAQRGRFSPFLFKGTVFSTGGYSALYGQALSSALILESIDLPERSEIDGSISPLFLGAGTQHLAKNKKSSWGINYGYTNVTAYFQIVKQKPDYFHAPEYHSAEANYRFKTKKGGMVKFYTSFNYNKLGLRRPNIDSALLKNAFGLDNSTWYNNVSYKGAIGRGWKMNLAAGYSTSNDNINAQIQDANNYPVKTNLSYIDSGSFSLKNRQDLSQGKVVLEKKLRGISLLRVGGEYWYSYTKINYQSTNPSYPGTPLLLEDNLSALFAETDIYLTNNIAAKAGVRFEHSSLLNKSDIAPRLSLAYKTGKDAQMSLAYGTFYQKPENMYLYFSPNMGMTKATHYIANYQKMNSFYTFRVEAFYKQYEDLVKTNVYPYNNSGDGFARGVEVFWRDRKTLKNVDYWISYSYLDTKRNYLNYPEQLQPNFAANHTASLVLKKFYTSIKTGFNFTYSCATGRPYYDIVPDNNNKYYLRDRGMTDPYSNLGFSLNYLPNLGKQNSKTFIVIVASMTNVLNTNQVYGYNYSYHGIKQPINPPANQFYFLGCFLSWGIDRSQDAINNNL